MPAASGRTLTVRLASGLHFTRFAADRGLGRAMSRDTFERAELACAVRRVGPGDVVIDGGAHLGLYALTLAQQVGPSGHVLAFEPHPESRMLLSDAVARNGFLGRVSVRAAALAHASRRGSLRSGRRCSAHAHACLHDTDAPVSRAERLFPIDIVALDDLDLDRRVGLIKLDVEGAELLAVRGALRLIRRDRPAILCELGDEQLTRVSGRPSEHVIRTLAEVGYHAREIRPDGTAGARFDAPPTARVATVLFLPND
jgi:FkbM family methyltransferase